jgi:hypothetical protein
MATHDHRSTGCMLLESASFPARRWSFAREALLSARFFSQNDPTHQYRWALSGRSGCGYERPDRRGRFQWREVGGLTFCPEERGFRGRGVRIKGVLLYFNLGVFGSITSHATIILTPPPSARKRITTHDGKEGEGTKVARVMVGKPEEVVEPEEELDESAEHGEL